MITIIVLVVVLGIVVGYAARQGETLVTTQQRVEDLLLENADLLLKNADLNHTLKSCELSIEMVLGEVDRLS